jgi:hypothetical protein
VDLRTVHADVGAELADVKDSLDAEIVTVRTMLSVEILNRTSTVNRFFLSAPTAAATESPPHTAAGQASSLAAGPIGHCS